ncbi:hypothetical protein CBP36_11195 [Acidovorax carolinensis]|uniref:Glycosyltransferase RgtA/B/C/D-like domain-containing protein n=1 Tax=Acidovorax carolinensis TaxID=553814 RepID=A0A240UE83_9BURK|nr:hypothetical protein [Acidovorax carolinensis]ART54940.1 hypothetical protein CBP35_07735 [Acidovorax carolinensis]ART59330.1 hypothetical protein CBP36_11195 [Acidovorax carolinensis]
MAADEQNYSAQSAQKSPMENALVALCAAGTVLIISWLIRYSAYGIDFTDESFYLVWIANPFLYDVSVYLFGFVYHPLYSLLGGDIAALRQANILITFGLAWILTYIFLVSLVPDLKVNRITLLTLSAGFATSAFILFDSWLPTPSYNSLALQSLLISTIGLILADKSEHRASILGWVLIGVGGWLTFMAKPSSALALAVGVFIYLLLARKLSIRMLALAVSCSLALLLISALLIDGSILLFLKRIQLGVEFIGYLGGGHSASQILRIDEFQLGEKLKTTILLISGALLLALWSMCTKNKKWSFIGLLISITLFLITASLTLGQMHRAAGFGQFQGLLIFAVVYAATAAALAHGRLQALKTVSARQWSIAALFLVMPHIYAFGTNGNYWQAGSSAAIFWLLAGLTLLGPLIRERASWLLALPLAVAAQAVTTTLLQTGLEQPYRQPQPLRFNVSNLDIGPQRSALTLSEDYSAYIASAMAAAKNAGFDPNMPMIDLSGQSPGILYSLGAKSIGQAWIIGGYPGSLNFAEASLSRTSCEKIGVAWILFEPDGPRSISPELMSRLGADFPGAYKQVGMWQTAEGAGGYKTRRTQELYRPVKPQETMANCQMLRQKSQK